MQLMAYLPFHRSPLCCCGFISKPWSEARFEQQSDACVVAGYYAYVIDDAKCGNYFGSWSSMTRLISVNTNRNYDQTWQQRMQFSECTNSRVTCPSKYIRRYFIFKKVTLTTNLELRTCFKPASHLWLKQIQKHRQVYELTKFRLQSQRQK